MYDIGPGNGARLFWLKGKGWKSKKTDAASKKGKSKDRVWGSDGIRRGNAPGSHGACNIIKETK